ncbi:MAG TPA: sialidase family protein [Daejeonella sp.]|nr:sialidase family protein [Daejeonella sp.]
MKKSTLNILAVTILLFSASCEPNEADSIVVKSISNTSREAASAYLTNDNNGNAVLCWTEQSSEDSLYRLVYATYNSSTNNFGKPVIVSPSAGTKASPESMNKVAFKADGSVVAVFTRKFENQKNPFAGAILYSTSANQGKSWSEAQYLHSDTSHTYGRSYFDLARMKNGEIAAIWLDGRYGKADTGSALFFASTAKGKGFANEKCIDRSTCQCCRTELLASNDGKLHIAYRRITFPVNMLGKQVRDLAYTYSMDNGRSFGKINTISHDNWAIDGCPHTGPSLAENGSGVYALWFTAGNSPGVYSTRIDGAAANFNPRELQSKSARHPQLISLDDKRTAMVWEEAPQSESPSAQNNNKHDMNMMHSKASLGKISLKILKDGKAQKTLDLTNGDQSDNHAVLTATGNGVLVAWVSENKSNSGIRYAFVKTDE